MARRPQQAFLTRPVEIEFRCVPARNSSGTLARTQPRRWNKRALCIFVLSLRNGIPPFCLCCISKTKS